VSLSTGALRVERGLGAPLPDTLSDKWKKALEMGIYLHTGPSRRLERVSVSGDFER
jgi:hypothetical protein